MNDVVLEDMFAKNYLNSRMVELEDEVRRLNEQIEKMKNCWNCQFRNECDTYVLTKGCGKWKFGE